MTPINHTHADSHHRFESQLWDSSSDTFFFLYSTFLFTSLPLSSWRARAAGESHTAAPRPVRRQGGAWRRGPEVGYTPEDGRPATAALRRCHKTSPAGDGFPGNRLLSCPLTPPCSPRWAGPVEALGGAAGKSDAGWNQVNNFQPPLSARLGLLPKPKQATPPTPPGSALSTPLANQH